MLLDLLSEENEFSFAGVDSGVYDFSASDLVFKFGDGWPDGSIISDFCCDESGVLSIESFEGVLIGVFGGFGGG